MNEEKATYNLLTHIQKINNKEGKALLSGLSIKDINLMSSLLERNFITAKEEVHDQGTTFSHVQIESNGIKYLDFGPEKETASVWNIDRRLTLLTITIALLAIIIDQVN